MRYHLPGFHHTVTPRRRRMAKPTETAVLWPCLIRVAQYRLLKKNPWFEEEVLPRGSALL